MTVTVEQFAIILVLIRQGVFQACPEPKRDYMMACIAQCLNLNIKKICTVNYTTGGFIDENCVVNRPFQKTLEVTDQKIMVCEVPPNNDAYLKLPKITDFNLCTHFHFGPWHLYNPISKNLEQRTDNIQNQWPFKEYVQNRGFKTILSFGHVEYRFGVSPGNWSILTANVDSRRKLIDQIINETEEFKFDAINIYWRYSACPENNCARGNKKDKENLVYLMREIHSETKEKGISLFLITPASERVLNLGYDMNELWNYVDYFNVPTYLYEGIWNNYLGYVANVYNIKISIFAIREKLGHARMNKVIGGITSTVAQYSLVKQNPRPKYMDPVFTASSQSSYAGIFTVCELVKSENFSVILDDANNNFAHNKTHVYVYEDLNTLREKVNYFKANGLGGMFYASLHMDDDELICGCGVFPILRIAAELLHGGGCILKQCLK